MQNDNSSRFDSSIVHHYKVSGDDSVALTNHTNREEIREDLSAVVGGKTRLEEVMDAYDAALLGERANRHDMNLAVAAAARSVRDHPPEEYDWWDLVDLSQSIRNGGDRDDMVQIDHSFGEQVSANYGTFGGN